MIMRTQSLQASRVLRVVVGGALWLQASFVSATPPATPEAGTTNSAPSPSAPASTETATPAPDEEPTHATISFSTVPNVTAVVTWGRKILGQIKPGKPLVIVRPRDSGPLDVIVRAKGYLAVQTRAHTFTDTRVAVKLTPVDKKSELLGYRAPIEPEVDVADEAALSAAAAGDAGVAPEQTPPHP